jgi:hypothetical protein
MLNRALDNSGRRTVSGPQLRRSRYPIAQTGREMPDKGLFGFVAVFGFAPVIALKLYNYNPIL